MNTQVIKLTIDTDDTNSVLLYNTVKKLKRGHRMKILADIVLSHQEIQMLIPNSNCDPTVIAKILEAISDQYRANTLQPSKDSCRISGSTKMPPQGFKTIVKKQIDSFDATVVSSENMSISELTKTPLNIDEYQAKAVEIAKDFIFKDLSQVEQKKLMMQWACMDTDELYEELVTEQLWFQNMPEKLPDGFSSMFDYTEHEMSSNGYVRKAE